MTSSSFDASFAGKSRRRFRGVLVVLLAVTITLAAVAANVALRRAVEEVRLTEVLLLQLQGFAYRLSALEWQAISEREMSSKIVANVQDAQDGMNRTMGSLEQLDPDSGDLRSVRQTYGAYVLAMNEEFSLIKAGNFSQAQVIDEELVDPAFDAFTHALRSSGAAHHAQANQIEQQGFFGSMLILLLTIVTIGVLVLQNQKAQAATEAATAEQNALARGQAELRLFADNVPSMTVSFGENLCCVFANKRYAEFFGFDSTEIIGKHLREILGEKAYSEVESHFTQALQGRSVTYERAFQLQDSESRYLEVRLHPDIGRRGQVLGCFAVVHDITERKKTEDRIVHLNRVYAVLSGINSLIVRVRGRDELYREACRIVVEAGGFRMSLICTVDSSTMKIVPVASAGKDEALLTAIRGILSSSEDAPKSMVAQAIREKKAVVSNVSQSDSRVLIGRKYAESGVRSMAVLPLIVSDVAIGALALYASESEFFHDEEMKLLTELAGDVAFALDHISKEEKIARLTRIQAVMSGINSVIVRVKDRQLLFNDACRIAVEHGNFGIAWVGSFDPATQDVEAIAWAGIDAQRVAESQSSVRAGIPHAEGVTGRAVRQKKPVFNNDLTAEPDFGSARRQEAIRCGYRSAIALPLLVDGAAIGALTLYAKEPNFFDEEEISLLAELAGDISFAIDHIDKQEKINYLAYYDVLTGLANRSLFLERVAQYLRGAAGSGHKLALFLVDLERFKNINDSLGRPAGDVLLKQVAEWLTLKVGDASLLARFDADHFALVLPEVRQDGDLARLVEKTSAAFLEHPFRLNDAIFRIAAKVGVAVFPDDGADADTLFRNAEAALKKAKATGDQYLFYTQTMTAAVAGKLTLENQLRQALDNGEFVLHYQPKVNFANGKVTGAEALIRWNDPATGLVPPGRFIPILEETGLIYDVGRWALKKAIEDYLRWQAAGLPAVRIAVNVSPLQLRNRGFIDEIEQVIGIDALAAAGLELEITESLIMEDIKHNISSLTAIRAMGVTIAIDDFGTGFSSLSYLAKLPVDTLKIDRSFVIDMTAGPDGLALVSTIINLAHSLKLKVVAEGVETEEQSQLLRLLSCDEMQGFLFSKPVPAEIFEANFLALPAVA